jgi:hypothetical protein
MKQWRSIDELGRLGATRVAVAAPYYSLEWKAMLTAFPGHGPYRIEAFQTFVEQGPLPDQGSVSARHYQFSEDEVLTSLVSGCQPWPPTHRSTGECSRRSVCPGQRRHKKTRARRPALPDPVRCSTGAPTGTGDA